MACYTMLTNRHDLSVKALHNIESRIYNVANRPREKVNQFIMGEIHLDIVDQKVVDEILKILNDHGMDAMIWKQTTRRIR